RRYARTRDFGGGVQQRLSSRAGSRGNGQSHETSPGEAGGEIGAEQEGPVSLRHKARELALQILFQWDIHHGTSEWLAEFWAGNPVHDEARSFADALVQGVMTHVRELDTLIGRYAENWTVSRMAFIDRAVL